MSLTDALLLEEPRPNLGAAFQKIWIALRTDGQRGSGTANDPFDGGVVSGSPIAVTASVSRPQEKA